MTRDTPGQTAIQSLSSWDDLDRLARNLEIVLGPLVNNCWDRLVGHVRAVDAESALHLATTFPTNYRPHVAKNLEAVTASWTAFPREAHAHHETINAVMGLLYAGELLDLYMGAKPDNSSPSAVSLLPQEAPLSVVNFQSTVLASKFGHWKDRRDVAREEREWCLLAGNDKRDVVAKFLVGIMQGNSRLANA